MHFPPLIADLAIILGVAAVVTFVFRLIKQPVVLGYVVAGIIVGPYTPSIFSVSDLASIKIWAELGVIFLMFSLGLEFSFRRLARVGTSAGITAAVQIVVMILLGIAAANFLNWTRMDAIFLGCLIAVSSTTIIIKALEEQKLKTKKFAELVFGILIVEDLVAILMLVALANIATTSEIDGPALLWAGGKLAIVVGTWFLVGMFLVPRFVKSVGRYGNDEMLTVVAVGFCLALVGLAAYFHYSVALGAFIMGSILAESSEAKRIEHLISPLKDIFGAVFFVSVGMLLDPKTLFENIGPILLISGVVIAGKFFSVSFGSFLTGQSIRSSLQAGLSMAQIGELSFIIASLGMTYGVINKTLYPVIVAASLVTTFTTPYFIKSSGKIADWLERTLPLPVKTMLDNYVAWMQRRTVNSSGNGKTTFQGLVKWVLNAVVVIVLFTLASDRLAPFLSRYLERPYAAQGISWLIAFIFSTASIWAMLAAFRKKVPSGEPIHHYLRSFPRDGALLASWIFTVGLVGLLSIRFFGAFITLMITFAICGGVFFLFRRQVESYYRWMELHFKSGFQADLGAGGAAPSRTQLRLAPWDAHLVEVKVPAHSFVVGCSLLDLKLREKYGLNVVVINRDLESIVAPKATELLYPGDRLLCFATDIEVERFKSDIEARKDVGSEYPNINTYELRRFKVHANSRFNGISIRESGIREVYDCIVVGLEQGGERVRSPKSETTLGENMVLWIIGDIKKLQSLAQSLEQTA